MRRLVFVLILSFASPFPALAARAKPSESLRVPAFTAYSEPEPEAVEVSEQRGITGWTNPRDKIVWYGSLRSTGRLSLSLSLRLPVKTVSSLRLTVAHQSRIVQAKSGAGAVPVTVDFGAVDIPTPGYYRFALAGLSKEGQTFGDPEALLLSGPAAKDAQFNLKNS